MIFRQFFVIRRLYICNRKSGVVMLTQVNSLNTVKNNQKPQMNTAFRSNPDATTNTLERTPTSDEVIKSTKKNKTKKTLLILGGTVLAAVGLFFAAKKGSARRVEKAFTELKNEPQKAQKTFQEVFLRDDITEKEAFEMVKKYEEIWKIEDKKEYIEALFKEAKKNYRLDDTEIKLAFDLPCEGAKNAVGFYSHSKKLVSITTDCSKKDIMNTMHHEFRHALQHRVTDSSDIRIKLQALVDKYADDFIHENPDFNPETQSKELEKIIKEIWEKAKKELKEKGYPETKEMQERYKFNKERLASKYKPFKVPEKYSDWVEKISEQECLNKYITPDENRKKYYEQFMEQDARFAGESIAKLFGMR